MVYTPAPSASASTTILARQMQQPGIALPPGETCNRALAAPITVGNGEIPSMPESLARAVEAHRAGSMFPSAYQLNSRPHLYAFKDTLSVFSRGSAQQTGEPRMTQMAPPVRWAACVTGTPAVSPSGQLHHGSSTESPSALAADIIRGSRSATGGVPRTSYLVDSTGMKNPRAADMSLRSMEADAQYAMPLAAEGARSASQPAARSGSEGR